MTRLRLTLEYDGTGFRGWARQPGLRTVEGVVRDALDAVFPHWDGLAVAGRTDSGVHATGQVARVDVDGGPPPDRVADALNAALPEDVAVRAAAERRDDFNARFCARSRSYRYRVLAGRRSALEAHRVLSWPARRGSVGTAGCRRSRRRRARLSCLHADRDAVRGLRPNCVERPRGHDAATGSSSTITADSFLRHMVRALVGTMLEAGRRRPSESASCSRVVPRSEAGTTAPPRGLYLERVALLSGRVPRLEPQSRLAWM